MQRVQKEYCTNGIMYHIGKAKVYVVTPVITEEEKEYRLEEIRKVIFHLLYSNWENYN